MAARLPRTMEPELLDRLQRCIPIGALLATVGLGLPNEVISLTAEGAYVATERTKARGSGPQLVPAWMLQVGWDELERTGRLEQLRLRDELGVKRSAFVMTALAQLPEVAIRSGPPVHLTIRSAG